MSTKPEKEQESAATPQEDSAVERFKHAFLNNLHYVQGKDKTTATPTDNYIALAYTVRAKLMERWLSTRRAQHEAGAKKVYYFSAEYLMGRQLRQSLMMTDSTEIARTAITELGLDINELIAQEPEPGLGNGGLGRLGACFLDSLATMDIPSMGYGIRYEFGIFKQSFQDGWQVESPDNWIQADNPWDFPHLNDNVEIGFGGYTETYTDEDGKPHSRWIPDRTVLGIPYNMMVPGYKTNTVNTLRLWTAKASQEFNLKVFDAGNYDRAVEQKNYSETISKVLYPNDNTPQGKQLRLEQQYFFVACSLVDILRDFRKDNDNWDDLPNKVTIQLNDTHPTVAVAELMRLLIDVHLLEWKRAWGIIQKVFASTQHTLLPESLERWSVSLFKRLLPRHMEIIYEINHRFLELIKSRFPNDYNRISRMSIIEEGHDKQIRMAHLACVASYSVNGVAALQSKLLRERLLPDFYELWPEKFNNKTNGVTPRRFMHLANPRLSSLITSKIGEGWLNNLDKLKKLEKLTEQAEFRKAWRDIKHQNKQDLAVYIEETMGLKIDSNSIYDIIVKRLHEYKRQLLKALHIVTLYNRIKANPDIDIYPRTFIFGAKAAPGYYMAKLIIKLINSIAKTVNNDPDVRDRLKVVFVENFNVSLAQKIYPAADISEQISMAGKEASGTGNMKFALNGALTTGTLDGANVEIRDCVGPENFFLFGLTTEQVFDRKARGYHPWEFYNNNQELRQVIDKISSGYFANGDSELFRPIIDSLMGEDEYMLFADYQAYIECQDRAVQTYRDTEKWTRMSILNAARCGFFSSDRAMHEYCTNIWQVKPVKVEMDGSG
ncbi:glycogen/starch/alpha-glucan phosphorylase [Anaerolineales bacterium HSG24]|nr:glycogen/starch/alpha-glucan phosphorylase [Anaerolineales bacterium HSG24]